MSAVAFAGAVAVACITFAVVLALLRHRAYRRRIFYDSGQGCVLGMVGPAVETRSVRCSGEGFTMPEPLMGVVSGLIEVEVHASATGMLFDPAVEIRAGDFCDYQYLERGVRGTRFLNISRLLNSKLDGESVRLRGHGLTVRKEKTRVHLCREKITAEDRVLVVAPHPDDAEIAAFGLYSDTRATIVTLTAGDASDRYQNPTQPWMSLSRSAIANMRVWDSLTIPQLGGVPHEQAINFCYPDGRLMEMYLNPDHDFQNEGGTLLIFSDCVR